LSFRAREASLERLFHVVRELRVVVLKPTDGGVVTGISFYENMLASRSAFALRLDHFNGLLAGQILFEITEV